MKPSTSDSTDGSLDSFFMSLAMGPDGKTLETGPLPPSREAAKIMQYGITRSSPRLFARGFEAHVDRVLYGIEPKNRDSSKQEEEKKSKFLHVFEAKEEDGGNQDLGKKTKAFSRHEAEEEETCKIDLIKLGRKKHVK